MIDINSELRTSYFSLISGNITIDGQPVPYYYAQVPINTIPNNPNNYILLSTIYSTNRNDDKDIYLLTNVQFTIVTKSFQNNSGAIKDAIASQLYSIVFPDVRAHSVQIVHGQVFDTKMFSDVEQSGLSDGEKHVLNRIVIFQHKIKIDGGGDSNIGAIYYGVQLTNADPTVLSGVINQDGSLPVSVDYGVQSSPMFYWLAIPATFDLKENWEDLNDNGNAGDIGEETDLYEVRNFDIDGVAYKLYMTRYLTGFNEPTSQVRYS